MEMVVKMISNPATPIEIQAIVFNCLSLPLHGISDSLKTL
jgi:hypothetical protein